MRTIVVITVVANIIILTERNEECIWFYNSNNIYFYFFMSKYNFWTSLMNRLPLINYAFNRDFYLLGTSLGLLFEFFDNFWLGVKKLPKMDEKLSNSKFLLSINDSILHNIRYTIFLIICRIPMLELFCHSEIFLKL